MGKINLLITEANGNLSNEKGVISSTVRAAEEY